MSEFELLVFKDDVATLRFQKTGRDMMKEWHHSDYPHPLVCVDYDESYKLIGVTVYGVDEKASFA
jgi:hypothetical protein